MPQISLSIRTPLGMFLREPELVIKGESATCITPPTLQPAGSMPGENFEQLSFSGASVQLNFPAIVKFGAFSWLLGPSVQIPFVHVTLRTRIKSFSNDPMYVADWQAKVKPFFSMYTAFQYDVKRYSLKINASKMTSLSYWGTDSGNYYINTPVNLGATLGYRF
ncbi:hypothetical protein [Spirosoma pollinicola]|nr:hypothetical protein [Spirosoma pollinicola]